MLRLLSSDALGSILAFPPKFEQNIVNSAKVNKWRCLEENGQWLENVDQTQLLMGSGIQALQKIFLCQSLLPQKPSLTTLDTLK